MARPAKALSIPANDGFSPDRLEQAGEAAKQLVTLQQGYGQGRDLVNQMIGHAQSRMAMRDFANVMTLAVLKQVKENKLYKGADGQTAYDREGNEIPNVGTWEGFCRAVGVSVAKADEDIANFNAFGEEALTSMQMVGIGYRDLRQFRKLPAEQRTALIEAAKAGDKDSLIELAEDLIAKHTKEKADLKKQVSDLQEDAKANEERRSDLLQQNEKLKEQLVRIKREKPEEALEAARSEAGTILAEVLGRVQGDFRAALQTLHELGRDEVYMAGMVGQVGAALNELRAQFDLPDLSNAQDAALAAEVAQWAPQAEQAGA